MQCVRFWPIAVTNGQIQAFRAKLSATDPKRTPDVLWFQLEI